MKFHDNPMGECFLCGKTCQCARHHLIGGAYRGKADRLGLFVPLCPDCHERVHRDGRLMRRLRAYAQEQMLFLHGWTQEKWLEEFDKNYLEE